MSTITIKRSAAIPDPIRIARYRQAPSFGPRICFFSGGTALTETSRAIKTYTHQSAHLISPTDSGGSSAKLRQTFDMPAIGDLRNRMMALADDSVLGHPRIVKLFATRLPKEASRKALKLQLLEIADGNSEDIKAISNPMRQLICNHLGYFLDGMPSSFDLRGANIGNLILAGGYLNQHNDLEPIVFLFSKLVNVLGEVRLTTESPLHLRTYLEDGTCLIGQHLMTGKEQPEISSPVSRIELVKFLKDGNVTLAETKLSKRSRKAIERAELICYAPGSFYSSLVSNLLIPGVGKAISEQSCPKVFVPSLGKDPETLGRTLSDLLDIIFETLRKDTSSEASLCDFLDLILLDSNQSDIQTVEQLLKKRGVASAAVPLTNTSVPTKYDGALLSQALISLV